LPERCCNTAISNFIIGNIFAIFAPTPPKKKYLQNVVNVPKRLPDVAQSLETEDDPVLVLSVENGAVAGAVGAQVLLQLQDDGLKTIVGWFNAFGDVIKVGFIYILLLGIFLSLPLINRTP
jgi:hypothetical protein